MNDMLYLLAERISTGLQRRAITSCSRWAESYRIMGQPFPGPMKHDHHPWTRDMRDCDAEMMIGQKGAQLGFTEVALDKVFFNIDILGRSALYILPTSNPDASVFSTSRFDPALEMSPHLNNLFSDVKNIGHKRAGNASLYIRGSRSRSQLKSVPAGIVVLDEIDEFAQENIPLIFERMSGQMEKQSFLLSTPTIEDVGINKYFQKSTKEHFFFKCPCCSRLTELTFPECLHITGENWYDSSLEQSSLLCKECKGTLKHLEKLLWLQTGRWVPEYTDRHMVGYHVNQLYSPAVRPDEIAIAYLKAQTNPTDEQEFYNSKLGLVHTVDGARILDTHLEKVTGGHKTFHQAPDHAYVTMGVDVGKWLHYEIAQWHIDQSAASDINLKSKCKVIAEGKVLHFEELDALMRKYRIAFCVIDANPERRKALEFAQRFWGHVRLCFYANGIHTKQITIHKEEEHTISVDRTSWIDLALGRFFSGKISIPIDASHEYKRHLKALVRIYKKDALGNPVGKYENGSHADHFAHARTYNEMALALGAKNLENVDITDAY